jgi:hypothetical protein
MNDVEFALCIRRKFENCALLGCYPESYANNLRKFGGETVGSFYEVRES